MKLTNLGELNGSTFLILNAAQERERWRKGLAFVAWFWRDVDLDTLSLAIVEAIIPMAQPVESLELLLPPTCHTKCAASLASQKAPKTFRFDRTHNVLMSEPARPTGRKVIKG